MDITIGTQLPPIIMGISYIIPKDIHIPFYINLHWNKEIKIYPFIVSRLSKMLHVNRQKHAKNSRSLVITSHNQLRCAFCYLQIFTVLFIVKQERCGNCITTS